MILLKWVFGHGFFSPNSKLPLINHYYPQEQFSSLIWLLRDYLISSPLFSSTPFTTSSTQCPFKCTTQPFSISFCSSQTQSMLSLLPISITLFTLHLAYCPELDMAFTSFREPSPTPQSCQTLFQCVVCPLFRTEVINPGFTSESREQLRPKISDSKAQEYGILFWVLYLETLINYNVSRKD